MKKTLIADEWLLKIICKVVNPIKDLLQHLNLDSRRETTESRNRFLWMIFTSDASFARLVGTNCNAKALNLKIKGSSQPQHFQVHSAIR
jgi:hypothetical protein